MKCFYHRETDAVALCKSCSRALCSECAADVPPGTACRNRCEHDVAAINIMIERNKTAYQKTGAAHKRNAAVLLITGLLFFSIGALPVIIKGDWSASFSAIIGPVFLLGAYFSYKNGRQIESMDSSGTQRQAERRQ